MKKLFITIFIFVLSFCYNVFAEETSIEKREIETRNGKVTIESLGGTIKVDYRCLPELRVTISESESGILEEGKAIYFGYDKEIVLDAFQLEGDTIQTEIQNDRENQCIKVDLKKNNNNQKTGTIHLDLSPYYSREIEGEPTISLWLITGKEYENNLFSEEKENIVLQEKFVKIENKTAHQENIELVTIKIGKNWIEYNEIRQEMPLPIIRKEDGTVFISVQTAELIGKATGSLIAGRKEDGVISIFSTNKLSILELGSSKMDINDKQVSFLSAPEIMEGEIYIPVRMVGMALGYSNTQILWDEATQTVTFHKI